MKNILIIMKLKSVGLHVYNNIDNGERFSTTLKTGTIRNLIAK